MAPLLERPRKTLAWMVLALCFGVFCAAEDGCKITCESIRAELSAADACAKARKTLPRPKIGRVCQEAFKEAFEMTCLEACRVEGTGRTPPNRVDNACNKRKKEVPRPVAHKACVDGFTAGLKQTAALITKRVLAMTGESRKALSENNVALLKEADTERKKAEEAERIKRDLESQRQQQEEERASRAMEETSEKVRLEKEALLLKQEQEASREIEEIQRERARKEEERQLRNHEALEVKHKQEGATRDPEMHQTEDSAMTYHTAADLHATPSQMDNNGIGARREGYSVGEEEARLQARAGNRASLATMGEHVPELSEQSSRVEKEDGRISQDDARHSEPVEGGGLVPDAMGVPQGNVEGTDLIDISDIQHHAPGSAQEMGNEGGRMGDIGFSNKLAYADGEASGVEEERASDIRDIEVGDANARRTDAAGSNKILENEPGERLEFRRSTSVTEPAPELLARKGNEAIEVSSAQSASTKKAIAAEATGANSGELASRETQSGRHTTEGEIAGIGQGDQQNLAAVGDAPLAGIVEDPRLIPEKREDKQRQEIESSDGIETVKGAMDTKTHIVPISTPGQ